MFEQGDSSSFFLSFLFGLLVQFQGGFHNLQQQFVVPVFFGREVECAYQFPAFHFDLGKLGGEFFAFGESEVEAGFPEVEVAEVFFPIEDRDSPGEFFSEEGKLGVEEFSDAEGKALIGSGEFLVVVVKWMLHG